MQQLAGRRVLVTGATGFVGQAVLERLVADCPDTRVAVLARSRPNATARQRVERLAQRPVFAAFRERVGEEGVRRALAERVTVLDGGLDDPPELPADLDVVIHCAATVSFDPPIDEAFTTNLLGAVALYDAVRRSGSAAHLVHVSTAYVAGMRRGVVPERSLDHDADWRAECDAALAARAQTERESRRPDVLDELVAAARRDHGRAGPQTVAADAERRRREWVQDRLVQHGRARAQSLGWPDVYTFTKALGERAVEALAAAAGLPLSVVRPSIIESALSHPYPGWIEGFKMADPIILGYGRGVLPDFPGIPEGVVDIIPVDYVANALLAVATDAPEPGSPAYFHVSSGGRNPLTFHELYEYVRGYFEANPLPDPHRGELRVPEWRFRGAARVERMLRTGERVVDTLDDVVGRLPRSDRVRRWATQVHRSRRELEFLRRYSDLYGAYTEAEVIYTDDAVAQLHARMSPADRAGFPFDAAAIDWRHYLQDVHCPSISAGMRGASGHSASPRSGVLVTGDRVLAVFDLEGTVVSSNVVETYLWLRLAELPSSAWPSELSAVAAALPRYLAAERRDRAAFLRSFYRRYEGASVEGLARLVDDHLAEHVLRRVAPAAVRRVREHRAAGHRTVLVTGALHELVAPLAPLFDTVVATRLVRIDGRYTGYLTEPPLVGEARAAWLRRAADAAGVDPGDCYGYGDSHSDLPLLEAVGHPVAVNPDTGLYAAARRRKWPVEDWRHVPGGSRLAVPSTQPTVAPGSVRTAVASVLRTGSGS